MNKRQSVPIAQGLLVLSLTYALIVAGSFMVLKHTARVRYQELALSSAKSIFDTVAAIRSWNAGHGGVYLPVSETLQPNPYLEDPLRDLVSTGGMSLTLVNPSFMTRLLADEIAEKSGIVTHITSLKPIRPANSADPWEREALTVYETTRQPVWSIETGDGEPVIRYLEGLPVVQSCLKCHAKQGYRLGDIRGGISVTIPYRRYELALRKELGNSLGMHILFFVLGLGLIWLVGWRLLASMAALEESSARVRSLEGLLPICSFCKKIRTAESDPMVKENWQAFENYISDRTAASFSHSICPTCLEQQYPEEFKPGS